MTTFLRIPSIPVLVRYYLVAVWPPFFLAFGIWLFILNLLYSIYDFLDFVFRYHAGFVNSLRLLLYIQPSYLVIAIPIAYLTALLVVYGRLSTDREAMALESSGVSPSILIWPMIGISLILSALLVLVMDITLPWGNTSYLKLQYRVLTERSGIRIHERVFIDNFDGYLLYAKEKDDRNDTLKGVTVEFLDSNSHPYRVILAPTGRIPAIFT
jgi:lipopolysaccharide export system permease protein